MLSYPSRDAMLSNPTRTWESDWPQGHAENSPAAMLLLLGNSWVGKLFSSQKSLKINMRSRNSSHSYF